MTLHSSEYKHLYNHRWRAKRAGYLRDNPLCVHCRDEDRVTAAVVVDHITPHKGDTVLFNDPNNWQALCKQHHDSAKKIEEHHGHSNAIGADGWPTDARHPVNAHEIRKTAGHNRASKLENKPSEAEGGVVKK